MQTIISVNLALKTEFSTWIFFPVWKDPESDKIALHKKALNKIIIIVGWISFTKMFSVGMYPWCSKLIKFAMFIMLTNDVKLTTDRIIQTIGMLSMSLKRQMF